MSIKEQILLDLDLSEYLNVNDISEVPEDYEGDYAVPCFNLAKIKKMAPDKIAQDICDNYVCKGLIKKVIPVGPYINIVLDNYEISKFVFKNTWNNKDYGKSDEGKGKNICIDYSSITLSKRVHIGHLCTTVIGECLAKLFENAGYNVIRINYLGDMGTPFGKIITMYKLEGNQEKLEKDGAEEVQRLYARFSKLSEEDETLIDKAREWSLKIENGDEEATKLCNQFKEVALKEAKYMYELLDIDFDDWRGEMYYNDKTQSVIDMLNEKGLLVESEGAQCVDLSKFNMGMCLIQRSDGGSLYSTRDLAAAIDRHDCYNFDKSLYVTGIEQNRHFESFFKVLELAGFDWAKDLEHIGYGRLSTKFGKISGREGNTPVMKDIFEASINKAREVIKERGLSDDIAADIGSSAVAFSVLKKEKIKDSVFDLDSAISFDGNSSVYLQYTYVRLKSLISKQDIKEYNEKSLELLTESIEKDLFIEIDKLPEVLKKALYEREPFYVTRYALNLASKINSFYNSCRIISDNKDLTDARLSLCKILSLILSRSMNIIGVKIIEKM